MNPGISVFLFLWLSQRWLGAKTEYRHLGMAMSFVEVEQLRVKNLIHMVSPRLIELFHLEPASSLEIP
jgi:hypothetical protein